ncbi:hypothetical protein [Gloeocapsa sp. PCC 73106]|uniref:hypothetical protein n=1 Tax=Gloeocapsa sp. PCC 73106 TaxID=102232 RepID=UPI0002AC161E|nr:hypothetical protein [Gloeocapsa sp. PCC 73106]ELR99983.1 hypothetical protein GLO73106DRAFT_00038370 [Gloeocapsa sp. PCC 73106]
MTIAEQFREKIKAGKFAEALTLVLSESGRFKVTTWISPEEYLTTQVNLVDGKIENEIGQKTLQNQAYQELCRLHCEQVQQGQEMIFRNLNSFAAILPTLEEASHSELLLE